MILDAKGIPYDGAPSDSRSLQDGEALIVAGRSVLFKDWGLERAVKDGLKSSVWVYRAVRVIAQNAVTVPFFVHKKGMVVDNHPLNTLLTNPSILMPSEEFWEIIYSQMLLAGHSLVICPDYMIGGPVPDFMLSTNPDAVTAIYDQDKKRIIKYKSGDEEFKPQQILTFRLIDPTSQLKSISPLQASAKIVDTDIDALTWNRDQVRNGGIPKGFISFKTPVKPQAAREAEERIAQTYSRTGLGIGVLGSDASFLKVSDSTNELDFNTSRKLNREEILAAFGVPPQLVGIQDSSTYNNFETSERVFWQETIIPFTNVVSRQLNYYFRYFLAPGEKISPVLSGVAALRSYISGVSESSLNYYRMGVPVREINDLFKIGIPEYKGWDTSLTKTLPATVTAPSPDERSSPAVFYTPENRLIPSYKRSLREEEMEMDEIAQKWADFYLNVLTRMGESFIVHVESLKDEGIVPVSIEETIHQYQKDFMALLNDHYLEAALRMSEKVALVKRSSELEESLRKYFDDEGVALQEYGHISDTTVNAILAIIRDGYDDGLSVTEISARLSESGVLSASRALTISRTVTGTAGSMGQFLNAKSNGAKFKTWNVADASARPLHLSRSGETVEINSVFGKVLSPNGAYPRYPLDPNLHISDRINCRCSLTFSV